MTEWTHAPTYMGRVTFFCYYLDYSQEFFMSYDIKMVKLVSGDIAIGKFDSASNVINDPATLQTVPTQQGVQMMLMPFGYPFDNDFGGSISMNHVIYNFRTLPEDLKTKYLEACSSLTLSSGGLGGLDLKGASASADASSLLLGK